MKFSSLDIHLIPNSLQVDKSEKLLPLFDYTKSTAGTYQEFKEIYVFFSNIYSWQFQKWHHTFSTGFKQTYTGPHLKGNAFHEVIPRATQIVSPTRTTGQNASHKYALDR